MTCFRFKEYDLRSQRPSVSEKPIYIYIWKYLLRHDDLKSMPNDCFRKDCHPLFFCFEKSIYVN